MAVRAGRVSSRMFFPALNKTTQSMGNRKMTSKSNSETESVEESDCSTSVSASMFPSSATSGQRVFRWSKFVRNLYDMAMNPENSKAVGFSDDGTCLVIKDSKLLSSDVLHKYFKHKNASSFVRQLNNYGFKTVPVVMNSSIDQCFAHDCFQRDRLDLLEGVTRRTAGSDAQKIGERILALREKEMEFDQQMHQLRAINETLKRQNLELLEENKRLRSSWQAGEESLRARRYEQHMMQRQAVQQHAVHQQHHQQQNYHQHQHSHGNGNGNGHAHLGQLPMDNNALSYSIDSNPNDIFSLPAAHPYTFPDDF